MPKPCDACQGSRAVVYCRADAAYLCIDCDAEVHRANKLASRHERVLMCEVCELTPAVVTCKADAAALCEACDTDIHSANPLARRHERVPVQPFFECSGVVKVAASVRNDTEVDGPDGLLHDDDDSSVAEAVSWLLPNPKSLDGVVPPLDKGSRTAVGAGRADDCCLSSTPGLMEHSLHLVPKLEKDKAGGRAARQEHAGGDLFHDVNPYLNLDYASSMAQIVADSLVPVHHPAADSNSPTEMSNASPLEEEEEDGEGEGEGEVPVAHVAYNYPSSTLSHSMSSSSLDVRVVPDSVSDISNPYDGTRGAFEFPPRMVRVTQMEPMAREARVLRYKEKRKNRKFEKTIRYASRKAYAESRPRIKGRFAKRTDPDTEQMYSIVPDGGFGIVPSF